MSEQKWKLETSNSFYKNHIPNFSHLPSLIQANETSSRSLRKTWFTERVRKWEGVHPGQCWRPWISRTSWILFRHRRIKRLRSTWLRRLNSTHCVTWPINILFPIFDLYFMGLVLYIRGDQLLNGAFEKCQRKFS